MPGGHVSCLLNRVPRSKRNNAADPARSLCIYHTCLPIGPGLCGVYIGVMRQIGYVAILAIVLGGCSTVPHGELEAWNANARETTYVLPENLDAAGSGAVEAFAESPTYMIAVQVDNGWCYARVVEGLALDQICQFDDLIRYSPDAPLATSLRPVPSHILALFDTLSSVEED